MFPHSWPPGVSSSPPRPAFPRRSNEYGGYKRLIGTTFSDLIEHPMDGKDGPSAKEEIPGGVLAVVYDKNKQEASG